MVDFKLHYEDQRHQSLPHIIKFSGGRSSGAMMVLLLEKGLLDAKRGDVIVFNNTSAEHPATYDFVRRCTFFAEDYSVPFYWVEYATYESIFQGQWYRRPTFRLVNHYPLSEDNPQGYCYKGEVFEELVSRQGFLPSRQSRICTAHLKVRPTNDFLTKWLGGDPVLDRLGHYWASPRIKTGDLYEQHLDQQGRMSEEEFARKRAFVLARPWVREEQRLTDFSPSSSSWLRDGNRREEYVLLMGIRHDEPLRIKKVKQCQANGGVTRTLQGRIEGEHTNTPLDDNGITKQWIADLWRSREGLPPGDLALPADANLSNCVYCFMKGTKRVEEIVGSIGRTDSQLPPSQRCIKDTPSDIEWWVRLEEKYQRVVTSRKTGDTTGDTTGIGCWGTNATTSYRSLRDGSSAPPQDQDTEDLPCDCFD